MKTAFFLLLLALCVGSEAFAQSSQTLQLATSSDRRAILVTPPSLPIGTTIFTFPDATSTIISSSNTEDYNWVLGGNSAPMTSNLLGTLTATNLVFVTGSGGPNTRMTIDGTTGGVSLTGDLDMINNLSGYNWPAAHVEGYLQNDGFGNLSWQTSIQASRAGLGTWFWNNYGGGPQVLDVSGTSIPFIGSAFPGGISGVSITLGNQGTAGTLTATVTKNGVATALTCTINGAANEQFKFAVPGAPIGFIAGDLIGVTINDVGFAPNNMDVLVTVFANF